MNRGEPLESPLPPSPADSRLLGCHTSRRCCRRRRRALLLSPLLFNPPVVASLSLSRASALCFRDRSQQPPWLAFRSLPLPDTVHPLAFSSFSLSLSHPRALKKKKKLKGRLLLRRALGPAQQRPPWHARRPLPGRPLLVQARMHGHRPQHAAAQADPRPRDGRRRPGRDVRHRRPLGRREIHAARDPFRVQAGRKDRGGHLDERPRRRQAVPPRLGVRQPGE